jgi:hypothetical protein
MRMTRRLAVAAALPCAALALTGCTRTVKASDVESKITKNLQGQMPGRSVTVDCPGGKTAEKGTTFSCDVKVDGSPAVADVTLQAEDRFSFRIRSAGAAGR